MSGNSINLPEDTGASVVQETQYGMMLPDGTVQWNTVSIRGREYAIKELADRGEGVLGRDWRDVLAHRAKQANVNPYDYSNMHKIITRQVMLAVTATQDARVLRPWPAPDPGQRPQPVEEVDPPAPPLSPTHPW